MKVTQTKHKKTVQSKKKLSKRLRISEHRARAARIKAKVERHRKKHRQAKTAKGFLQYSAVMSTENCKSTKIFRESHLKKKPTVNILQQT